MVGPDVIEPGPEPVQPGQLLVQVGPLQVHSSHLCYINGNTL